MANRVSQAPLEAVIVAAPKARVSQAAVEVIETTTTEKARVSQAAIEVVETSTTSKVRVSQVAIDVLVRTFVVQTGSFVVDAQLSSTALGSFTVDALVYRAGGAFQSGAFQAPPAFQVVSGHKFTVDAEIRPYFTLNAVIRKVQSGSFTLDAQKIRGYTMDAVIRRPMGGLFTIEAFLSRTFFHVDAQIKPGGIRTIDALILAHSSTKTFTVDAFISSGPTKVFTNKTIDAQIQRTTVAFFTTRAELVALITTHTGSAPVDAECRATFTFPITLDAELVSRTRLRSFTLDADLKGQNEKRGNFTLNAVVGQKTAGLVVLEAEIVTGRVGHLVLDAWIAGGILLDAEIISRPAVSGSFTLDALKRLLPVGSFTVNAVLADSHGAFPGHVGTFTADANIRRDGIVADPPIWLDAEIRAPARAGSFSLDAKIASNFTLDAWVRPYFTVNAYIKGNATIVYPPDGGPPLDSNGNPWPDWFKTSRKYRIRITSNGTDITGDINFAKTTFTQNAKTGAGTFEITLYGAHVYLGGEEIIVEIDDLRTFGGYVMTVEAVYVFDADATWTATVLHGTDYNVLFDRLFAYNKPSVTGTGGSYSDWKAFAKGTYDDTIIKKVFGSYVDLPAGFDYRTYVDRVGVAAIEEPWTMPTSGSSLRQTMQSLSQTTTAVWWIDPYLNLQNHARTTITAPYPITDGLGGISSQALSVSADITQMVNQTIVWGVLARDINGEITAAADFDDSSVSKYGRWQYGEFRTDLHHQSWIARRAQSILDRYQDPIFRAKAVIFEPGYQAGQGVHVISSAHGIDEVLVIRSMMLTMAVAKERSGNIYYGVPRYELSIGLDPESPWDIYDFLPFPDSKIPGDPPWNRDRSQQQIDPPPVQPCTGADVCGNVTVLSVGIGGGEIATVIPPGYESFSSASNVPPGLVLLYAGATYEVQVNVYHNPNEWAVRVGAGGCTFEMGGPGYQKYWDNPIYGNQVFASCTVTIGSTGYYSVGIEHITRSGFGGATSSASARFFYLGGSDPRFENLNNCPPPAGDEGWGTSVGGPCKACPPAVVVDDFDRSSGSGWLTSTDGHNWAQELATGATSDISGGLGRLSVTAGSSRQIRMATNAGGPWTATSWTMTYDFVPLFTSGHHANTYVLLRSPDDLRTIGLLFDTDTMQLAGSQSGTPSTSFTFVTGVVYHIKFDMVSWVGELMHWRARIWAGTDPEPSTWLLDYSGPGQASGASSALVVTTLTGSSTTTAYSVSFNDIIVDSTAGCDCGPTTDPIDTFDNRTLGPENPPVSSLGTASGGASWSGTSGGTGITQQIADGALKLTHAGVRAPGTGFPPSLLFYGASISGSFSTGIRVRFQVSKGTNDVAPFSFNTGSGATTYYPTYSLGLQVPSHGPFFQVTVWQGPSTPHTVLTVSDAADVDLGVLTAGVWYWLEAKIEGGNHMARVYPDGGTVPDWQSSAADSGYSLASGFDLYTGAEFIDFGDQWVVTFDDLQCVTGEACFESIPAAGEAPDPEGETYGVVGQGWGCETIFPVNGVITTTGLVSKSTLNLWDADAGTFIDPVNWVDQGDGKHFTILMNGVTRVNACYRNYVVNAQSTVTPRIVSPNKPRTSKYVAP